MSIAQVHSFAKICRFVVSDETDASIRPRVGSKEYLICKIRMMLNFDQLDPLRHATSCPVQLQGGRDMADETR